MLVFQNSIDSWVFFNPELIACLLTSQLAPDLLNRGIEASWSSSVAWTFLPLVKLQTTHKSGQIIPYFTNLDFPEIRGSIPLPNAAAATFGGLLRACEVAIQFDQKKKHVSSTELGALTSDWCWTKINQSGKTEEWIPRPWFTVSQF